MGGELWNVILSFGVIAIGETVVFGIAFIALRKFKVIP